MTQQWGLCSKQVELEIFLRQSRPCLCSLYTDASPHGWSGENSIPASFSEGMALGEIVQIWPICFLSSKATLKLLRKSLLRSPPPGYPSYAVTEACLSVECWLNGDCARHGFFCLEFLAGAKWYFPLFSEIVYFFFLVGRIIATNRGNEYWTQVYTPLPHSYDNHNLNPPPFMD